MTLRATREIYIESVKRVTAQHHPDHEVAISLNSYLPLMESEKRTDLLFAIENIDYLPALVLVMQEGWRGSSEFFREDPIDVDRTRARRVAILWCNSYVRILNRLRRESEVRMEALECFNGRSYIFERSLAQVKPYCRPGTILHRAACAIQFSLDKLKSEPEFKSSMEYLVRVYLYRHLYSA